MSSRKQVQSPKRPNRIKSDSVDLLPITYSDPQKLSARSPSGNKYQRVDSARSIASNPQQMAVAPSTPKSPESSHRISFNLSELDREDEEFFAMLLSPTSSRGGAMSARSNGPPSARFVKDKEDMFMEIQEVKKKNNVLQQEVVQLKGACARLEHELAKKHKMLTESFVDNVMIDARNPQHEAKVREAKIVEGLKSLVKGLKSQLRDRDTRLAALDKKLNTVRELKTTLMIYFIKNRRLQSAVQELQQSQNAQGPIGKPKEFDDIQTAVFSEITQLNKSLESHLTSLDFELEIPAADEPRKPEPCHSTNPPSSVNTIVTFQEEDSTRSSELGGGSRNEHVQKTPDLGVGAGSECSEEIQALKKKLGSLQESYECALRDLESKHDAMADLQSQLSEANEKCSELEFQMEQMSDKHKSTQDGLRKAILENDGLEREARVQTEKIGQLEEELAGLNMDLANFVEREREGVKREESLSRQLAESQRTAESLRQDKEGMSARVVELLNELQTLSAEKLKLVGEQIELASEHEKLSELQTSLSDKGSLLVEKEKALDELTRAFGEVQQKLRDKESECVKLKAEMEELKENMVIDSQSRTELENALLDLRRELATSQERFESEKQQLSVEHKAKVQFLEERLGEVERTVGGLEMELDETKAKLEDGERRKNELSEQLAHAESRAELAQSELAQLKYQLDQLTAELKDEKLNVERLQDQLSEEQKASSDLQRQLDDAKGCLSKLEGN